MRGRFYILCFYIKSFRGLNSRVIFFFIFFVTVIFSDVLKNKHLSVFDARVGGVCKIQYLGQNICV